MTTIGERFRKMREHKGMDTQSEFATLLGLSTSIISTLERDESQPSYKVLLAIKENMPEINLYWLLYGEGDMLLSEDQKIKVTVKTYKENPDKDELINHLKDEIQFYRTIITKTSQSAGFVG